MARKTMLRMGLIAGVIGIVFVGIAYAAIPHGIYGDTTAASRRATASCG